jgi:hypothetical protein
MEKYVLILELLVTKNIDKIDKDVTKEITKITMLKNNFNRTIWYKMVKILANLRYLYMLFNDKNYLKSIFEFILEAYKEAKENLCFYYIMKILMQIKKIDINIMVSSITTLTEYNDFFSICSDFLKNNYKEKNDPLILEILLYLIGYFDHLIKHNIFHDKINDNNIIFIISCMMSIHSNKYIMKAISSILANASKSIIFYADLLTENGIENIVKNIAIADQDNETYMNLFEC